MQVYQLAEQIGELQAEPRAVIFSTHLQRIPGYVRQMVAFIKHQQQVFRLGSTASLSAPPSPAHDWRPPLPLHQDLPPGSKKRALAVVVTVTVEGSWLYRC